MAVETFTHSPTTTPPARARPPLQGEWTYEDYARLPDNGMRYEVIEGELYMSPAPRPIHQRAAAALFGRLWEYLQRQPLGEAFFAPTDVLLPDLTSPVQPDILFIARENRHIVKDDFIEGVPDLVVEVLSPGNPDHDRRIKYQVYARAGVREYWIVDPEARTIDIYVLRGRAYAPLGSFGADDNTQSEVLEGFTVNVGEIC